MRRFATALALTAGLLLGGGGPAAQDLRFVITGATDRRKRAHDMATSHVGQI